MDLGTSTLLVGGAIGLALVIFGARMLVTGQAPAPTGRAFRTVRDAGLYHLLFGLALVFLVLGTKVGGAAAIVSAVLAVVVVAAAVIRYRPRGKRAEGEKP